MRPHASLAAAALVAAQAAQAADTKFVKLDDLEPVRDRVVYVEPAALQAATVAAPPAPEPWGVLQTVQVPLEGTVGRLHASGRAQVHVAPARELRVSVKTDPGLIQQARTALTQGTLRLEQTGAAQIAAWHVEGPVPRTVHAEDDARVEVASWEGQTLEVIARGDARVDIGHVRASSLRVVARDGARVQITGACSVEDLWVDTAVDARFDGCGFRQGG